jgi:hypothetical protein
MSKCPLMLHNFSDKDFNTKSRNTQAVLDASRKISLQVNVKKIQYTFVSYHKNEGCREGILILSRFRSVTFNGVWIGEWIY